MTTTIAWFRNDLRLEDNPAFSFGADRGVVIPLYILEEEPSRPLGGASRWWLHHSLKSLQEDCDKLGIRLIIRRGQAKEELPKFVEEAKADAVTWNRRYDLAHRERDAQIKTALEEKGVEVRSFGATLLHEPWTIKNKQGKPFRVFSPFWKTCLRMDNPEERYAAPMVTEEQSRQQKKKFSPVKETEQGAQSLPAQSLALEDLRLLPVNPDWAGGLRETWTPGAKGASERLDKFLADSLPRYKTHRDVPSAAATSMLSPHLRFGEISLRTVWHRTLEATAGSKSLQEAGQKFLAEIGWREFSYHLLYHQPGLTDTPLRPEFARFPWLEDAEGYRLWCKGQTGYPIVDAGMRELWQTGFMHNRVRMIVASFLVKHLLIPWQKGEAWFWDTLVDADPANNTASWQWVAGCGADAAPYFRIFNPILQGEKFDPEGLYVKKYVPELRELPEKWLHKPWEAPKEILKHAKVELGKTYPKPYVNHPEARIRALEAYATIRQA